MTAQGTPDNLYCVNTWPAAQETLRELQQSNKQRNKQPKLPCDSATEPGLKSLCHMGEDDGVGRHRVSVSPQLGSLLAAGWGL